MRWFVACTACFGWFGGFKSEFELVKKGWNGVKPDHFGLKCENIIVLGANCVTLVEIRVLSVIKSDLGAKSSCWGWKWHFWGVFFENKRAGVRKR